MRIADDSPDIVMLVEIILKAQVNPIDQARLYLPGFNAHYIILILAYLTSVFQALVVLQYS